MAMFCRSVLKYELGAWSSAGRCVLEIILLGERENETLPELSGVF